MSLLTKEQEETLERVRQISEDVYNRGNYEFTTMRAAIALSVGIIDDLQARAPKPLVNEQADKTMKDYAVRLLSRRQYTEQELVMIFQKGYPQYWQGMSGDYFQRGFREALRRVGALKAEP